MSASPMNTDKAVPRRRIDRGTFLIQRCASKPLQGRSRRTLPAIPIASCAASCAHASGRFAAPH